MNLIKKYKTKRFVIKHFENKFDFKFNQLFSSIRFTDEDLPIKIIKEDNQCCLIINSWFFEYNYFSSTVWFNSKSILEYALDLEFDCFISPVSNGDRSQSLSSSTLNRFHFRFDDGKTTIQNKMEIINTIPLTKIKNRSEFIEFLGYYSGIDLELNSKKDRKLRFGKNLNERDIVVLERIQRCLTRNHIPERNPMLYICIIYFLKSYNF